MKIQNFSQAARFLYELQLFGIKLGLEKMSDLLAAVGNPHEKLKFIHIAGTNGKGSVAAMLAAILFQAGYKTGLYTSPHLVDVCERIRVNGQNIDRNNFTLITEKLQQPVEKLKCTFFEAMTALALLHFEMVETDIVVLEVGLGGRLDATNVVFPEISVITNIDMDHQKYLGRSIKKIAAEKAGIIKKSVPCIIGDLFPSAEKVIEQVCEKRGSQLFRSSDICSAGNILVNMNVSEFWLSVKQIADDLTVKMPLVGAHQVKNACLAAGAIAVLQPSWEKLKPVHIQLGLEYVSWPARFQVMSQSPLVIVDAAHNVGAFRELVMTIQLVKQNFNVVFVIGFAEDKDFRTIIRLLKPVAQRFIAVQANTNRSLDVNILARELKLQDCLFTVANNIQAGVEKAYQESEKKTMICITGSHFVVGEAINVIKHLTN
ncbi:bifunctional folylpolyglutamate synthase/dihydrofolate synthase [candidate division KSB1 bacterium]|nr:bifunctional folylpolyglutamate synthase/dihydrofolate synthase [candidate division KSB1 bacterium]